MRRLLEAQYTYGMVSFCIPKYILHLTQVFSTSPSSLLFAGSISVAYNNIGGQGGGINVSKNPPMSVIVGNVELFNLTNYGLKN